jgi:hypothetical protein
LKNCFMSKNPKLCALPAYGVPIALSVNEQEPHAPTKQNADLWYIRGWCVIDDVNLRQKFSAPCATNGLW